MTSFKLFIMANLYQAVGLPAFSINIRPNIVNSDNININCTLSDWKLMQRK